jgi:hypothetical protein
VKNKRVGIFCETTFRPYIAGKWLEVNEDSLSFIQVEHSIR